MWHEKITAQLWSQKGAIRAKVTTLDNARNYVTSFAFFVGIFRKTLAWQRVFSRQSNVRDAQPVAFHQSTATVSWYKKVSSDDTFFCLPFRVSGLKE